MKHVFYNPINFSVPETTYEILLKVDDMNTVAMNMYSSFGFKTWGRTMLLNLN